MRFQNKVALITAAANGIGRATAAIMVREGATVVAVDNNQGRLDEAVPSLRQAAGRNGKVDGRLVDALDQEQVDALVADVARDHGRIDILVNAVGGSTVIERPTATTEQLTLAEWQKLIAFNLDGTFLVTHAVIPVMKRQRGGKIVNLASIAGRGLSVNSSSAYAAARAASSPSPASWRTSSGPRASTSTPSRPASRSPSVSARTGRNARRRRRPRRSNARRCAASPRRSTRPT